MNLFFRNRQQDELPDKPKKKPRGKPFTGKGDPRSNLSGRPKLGHTLSERYRTALAEAESEVRGGEYTRLDALIDILMGKAMEGDQRAIEYLNERAYGKVPERIELSKGDDDDGEAWDLEVLDADELDYFGYLTAKATHQEYQQRYRFTLTKKYVDTPQLPDVIEGKVKE